MAELINVADCTGSVTKHAIFIHGLNGDKYKTWQLSNTKKGWLHWLAEDIPGLAVWTVGYDASISRWSGHAMHLTDRATNILERLLREQRLSTGEIVFVGHSFGGLVIKQLLRKAESIQHQRPEVAEFVKRVRRIAFLATPHAGSGISTFADRIRIVLLPSAATAGLVRNDPNLRDLNLWYRQWSHHQRIDHLVLTETQPIGNVIIVVEPDSSDPGVLSQPIPIDANHYTICKPTDRSSEIYLQVRDFLERGLDLKTDDLSVANMLEVQGAILNELLDSSQQSSSQLGEAIQSLNQVVTDQGERTADIVVGRILQQAQSTEKYPKELIDNEIIKRLSEIRRARFFREFATSENTTRLGEKIQSGVYAGGSDNVKSVALAWCARILSAGGNNSKSDELLELAKRLGSGLEITIAEAFKVSASGDLEGALNKLANNSEPVARSASFFIVSNHKKNAASEIAWLAQSGLSFAALDSDGKYLVLMKQLELAQWDAAIQNAAALQDDNFKDAPILYQAAAIAHLVKAIPDEVKSVVLQQVPFESNIFPLGSTAESLVARRTAQEYFLKLVRAAQELNCAEAAIIAEDYALWLELRDPAGTQSGMQKLQALMRDPAQSLRKLSLALHFGLKLDLQAVENEIDRQTALSGGNSPVAAMARFSLAFTLNSPKAIADYIDRHRTQLLKYLTKKSLGFFEIEILVRSGSSPLAETRLKTLADEGLTPTELDHLRRIINSAADVDPIESQKALFEESKTLIDLTSLVQRLEEKLDWEGLCHYGALLFERTKDLADAVRLAKCLNETNRYGELYTLLKNQPELIAQSDDLQMLWSWSLYREGDQKGALAALKELKTKRDHPNDRALAINIAITSGAWEDLLTYVEEEWINREKRTADELMRTAQLAHRVGSSRAKELAHLAATKGSDNAGILATAYFLASSAGWEEDSKVAQWLQTAAVLSDESGPLQKMSMKDLLERKPEWDRRENDTWSKLQEGLLPIFGAAILLNRSLVDMILLPALANPTESDPRRRVIIPAYSGSRTPSQCNYRTVAMESTALLNLAILGLLEKAFQKFDCIVIPHTTLMWLFDEKQKATFHQPSKIKDAHIVRQLIASGVLREFRGTVAINADLSSEIGDELASLIAEATSIHDERQRVVVRSAPVHRVGSIMEEDADLTQFSAQICSCAGVVDKLKQKGQITEPEERRARSYLNLHERRWPAEPVLSDGAIIYLDSLSVVYLQEAGLLGKLSGASLETYISSRQVEEINALVRYEQLSTQVVEIIDALRNLLAINIQNGKVKIGRMPIHETSTESRFSNHPTFAVLNLANEAEAVIIDDRLLNQHQAIDSGSRMVPVTSTLDFIDSLKSSGVISQDEWYEYRTRLRRSSYILLPVTQDELQHFIDAATVADGTIVETAELKAIRENILKIRMSNYLQLPKDAPWLVGLMQVLINTLKSQWSLKIDKSLAAARSDWLLNLVDLRGWAHRYAPSSCADIVNHGYGTQIMSLLMVPTKLDPETRENYLGWLEDHVLLVMKEQDPDDYLWLTKRAEELIAHVIEKNISKEIVE